MAKPLAKIKKRHHPKFNVPNYGAKKRSRVKDSWRKQRGIDNKKRIKKDFMGAEPNIGYGNPKKLRGVRSNGKKLLHISNTSQLSAMSAEASNEFDVVIARSVGRKKREEMASIARSKGIRIINGV